MKTLLLFVLVGAAFTEAAIWPGLIPFSRRGRSNANPIAASTEPKSSPLRVNEDANGNANADFLKRLLRAVVKGKSSEPAPGVPDSPIIKIKVPRKSQESFPSEEEESEYVRKYG